MSNDNDLRRMVETMAQDHIHMMAAVRGLDLLLRALWHERAMQASDPEQFVLGHIERLCASMAEVDPPQTREHHLLYAEIEDFLRAFGENVSIRLRGQSGAQG